MDLINNIQEMVESCDAKLYDIETTSENDKTIYRVLIATEDDNKISIDKCAEISRLISPLIDIDPPVKGVYFLEVSSAGIERKLSKKHHYKLSLDLSVRVTLSDTTVIEGKLIQADDDGIKVLVDKDEEIIKYDDIYKAKTYWQW